MTSIESDCSPPARRRGFRCGSCGAAHPQWAGRCANCGDWNSLAPAATPDRPGSPSARAIPLADVAAATHAPAATGVDEFDRALSGGLVAGSVTLLGGQPGVGKSTLMLQVASSWARARGPVLMVSAEESAAQVRRRADRLDAVHDRLWLAGDPAVEAVVDQLDQVHPELLVVDSIQTVHVDGPSSGPGTPAQVRASAQRLVAEAKGRGLATVLVGHVVKDGGLAGPKVLEHVVDTVVELTGDRHHALRLLRVAKHRFGPTDELGVFEIAGDGMRSVADPSRLFLADRATGVPGSVVVPALEGHRPLLVELQALAVRATTAHPRRSSQGVDARRLALLLAVLERWAGCALGDLDVFVSAAGGATVTEPAADLAVALAVASATTGHRLPDDTVACGEVGLGGEVRQAVGIERRLAEAQRLGFRRAVVPASAPEPPSGLTAIRVGTLAEAVAVAFVPARSAAVPTCAEPPSSSILAS